uniref:Uncharacterized protein n=1 Tax=Romanomermis culicivorax TaxID=13658 RepID=A0A915KJT7_ROMCU
SKSSNKRRGVYLRAASISFLEQKCGIYSRAAFIKINTKHGFSAPCRLLRAEGNEFNSTLEEGLCKNPDLVESLIQDPDPLKIIIFFDEFDETLFGGSRLNPYFLFKSAHVGGSPKMYCFQWLIPVLLIPKPFFHPSMLYQHAVFIILYLIGFFIERKPCYICSLVFIAAVCLICYSDPDYCIFWPFCRTLAGGEQCALVGNSDSNGIVPYEET